MRHLHRRAFAGFAVVVVGSLLLFGAWIAAWLVEPNQYASVPSIETESTYRDPSLLGAAWRLPTAELYRRVPYEFQENQSFCGPASVANLLHSVGVARSQDAVASGSEYRPWFGFLLGGLTLDQLREVLRQSTARPVILMRDLSLEQFRQELVQVNEPTRRYIINFHRGPLFGRGHGHFSPLLAYLSGPDLVLVGDVNSSYRPFLVNSERLWQAMDTIDPTTKQKRGLLMVKFQSDAAAPPTGAVLPRASLQPGN